jgi:hypothetical protein
MGQRPFPSKSRRITTQQAYGGSDLRREGDIANMPNAPAVEHAGTKAFYRVLILARIRT